MNLKSTCSQALVLGMTQTQTPRLLWLFFLLNPESQPLSATCTTVTMSSSCNASLPWLAGFPSPSLPTPRVTTWLPPTPNTSQGISVTLLESSFYTEMTHAACPLPRSLSWALDSDIQLHPSHLYVDVSQMLQINLAGWNPTTFSKLAFPPTFTFSANVINVYCPPSQLSGSHPTSSSLPTGPLLALSDHGANSPPSPNQCPTLWLCPLLATWPWITHRISQPQYHICKMHY